ncbi:MAG: HAMP domain-containing histidine kinase [Magnetococcales bacterium]|nr:HAMP domain-containing histidine kinase [Magnetococcales bacterium]
MTPDDDPNRFPLEATCCVPLVEHSPDGIVVMWPDGRVLYANPAAERLFGRVLAELRGEVLDFSRTVGSESETILDIPGRSSRVVALRTVAVTWRKGESVLVATFRDVTERKRLEQELVLAKERAESGVRAKNRFLASMSHELRTPLNAIIGLTSLLLGGNSGSLTRLQGEYLRDVYRSGYHLLSLIDDILNWSNLAGGEIYLNVAQVVVEAFLAERLAEACEEAEEKEIHLTGDWSAAPERAPMDENLISRVVHALLSNAIKFTPERGRILLLARRVEGDGDGGSRLEIAVRDSGVGLTGEEIDRIFEPFTGDDPADATPYAGCGVGLSLTRSLVELHGGWIWVESAGRHCGSTFIVQLPL